MTMFTNDYTKIAIYLNCLLAISLAVKPISFHSLPGVHDNSYSQLGDINIGAMVYVLEDSVTHPAEKCSNHVELSTYGLESTETIAFAVDLVNRSPHILPNVSLGFILRGICSSPAVALATSISFLPRNKLLCNGSICPIQTSGDAWLSHDVVDVVGAGFSTLTLPISPLYAVGQLPIVGPTETSDELSNKRKHPYFFRITPPDMYQVQAMMSFISKNGWLYISVVYEDGTYGLNAYDRIMKIASKYGICVATSHRLIRPPNYDEIVSDLLVHYRARVVVLFIESLSFKEILQVVHNKNSTGHFIWLGSDILILYRGYEYEGLNYDPAVGTFVFKLHSSLSPVFYKHVAQLRVSTTKNPWLKPVWEHLFECSYDKGTCNPDTNILQSPKYRRFEDLSLKIDAVLTLAQAAHQLLSDRCPDAQGVEARACFSGELLREYLKNVVFDGFNVHVEFDENQEIKGKYFIGQIVNDYFKFPYLEDIVASKKKRIFRKNIGVYDISTDTFTYFNETVSSSHLTTIERFQHLYEELGSTELPQSKCSSPCGVREYKIEKELPCCWECRKCRENERLVKDNTTCEPCPSFMWPDSASAFTMCMDISPIYPQLNDPIPIAFNTLAILALALTICVVAAYIIYRDERVIKASSRELSIIQLCAILTGYTTVIMFQTKPSDIICGSIFFLFCMSFVLLYSPLLVKTVRICRIFKSGKMNQKPRFISSRSQLIFASFLIAVQVSLCITVYIMYSPGSTRIQPIWSEKLVELTCDLTFPGIASFLGYNIVLVFMCSVFAFMVRKLPDNFNESKFISMCVTTTLLIWLAFIPAYFSANRAFIRVFLLSVALFVNHSVALVFLFVPKIYAALFMPPDEGNFSKK